MTDTVTISPRMNYERGPITKRKFYWRGATGEAGSGGATISLLSADGECPREIRVFHGGDLNVTYIDGTTEIITGIPDNHPPFVDGHWKSISATSSTAYNIYVGW